MRIVGVTSCISGIAHTYLSAEALSEAAKSEGHQIKVETRGSIGAENVLTEADIEAADVVIIAADQGVPKERFAGKPVLEVGTHEVVKDARASILKAEALTKNSGSIMKNQEIQSKSVEVEFEQPVETGTKVNFGSEIYKHLMSGISFMIPFIVSGGIIIALSFAFSTTAFTEQGTLAASLYAIGSSAFTLMIPIMAGYIAYSIADRPGLVPGMVGGMLAAGMTSSGFLGGILAGFLGGYSVVFLKKYINLKGGMKAMMPILILPGLSTLIVGLLLIYVVGGPVGALNTFLTDWLNQLSGGSAVLLGFIVAAMIAADLGGVICRVGYAFAVATLASGEPSLVMASAMAGGLVPSTAVALATILAPHKFTKAEHNAGEACWVLGASFIVEGAIPFAARDPKVVLPAVTLGAGITGAISAYFGVMQSVPHGGIWVLPIPGAIQGIPFFLLAVAVGVAMATLMLVTLKKNVSEKKGKASDNAA